MELRVHGDTAVSVTPAWLGYDTLEPSVPLASAGIVVILRTRRRPGQLGRRTPANPPPET